MNGINEINGINEFLGCLLVIIVAIFIVFFAGNKASPLYPKSYFLIALVINIGGAIFIGLLYQYYYKGGDTFSYYKYITIINNAFWSRMMDGVHLIQNKAVEDYPELLQYVSRLYWYNDRSSFLVIRIGSVFSILFFNSYYAIAICFSIINFLAKWKFYEILVKFFPTLSKGLFILIFMIPSVVVWTSGLFKDTLSMGAFLYISAVVLEFSQEKKIKFFSLVIFLFWIWVAVSIKIYILICLVPSLILLLILLNMKKVENKIIKVVVFPVFLVIGALVSFFILNNLGKIDSKYSLNTFSETAKITAYDIGFLTGAGSTSNYDIGIEQLDGTFESTIKLAPQAIIVTLFRPFPWEVRNFLMALSSIEGFILMMYLIYILIKYGPFRFLNFLRKPFVLYLLSFSIVFAFAVGVSTFNFGTLSRYKAPCVLFFTIGLYLIQAFCAQDCAKKNWLR